MSSLQVIFDEINKNELVGTTCVLPPFLLSHEMMESILDSFDGDPDTDNYLSLLSEVLQVHRHEQQHVLDMLDAFLFQYMAQIKQDKDHPTPISFPSTTTTTTSSSHPSSSSSISSSSSAPPPVVLQGMVPASVCGYPVYGLPGFPQLKNNMMLTVPQKKRQNFSREITNVLSQWLFTHCDHPYPSEHEKSVLCSITGLSLSQVSGWFINARRRKLKKMNESSSPQQANGTSTISSTASGVQEGCEHVGVGKNEISLNFVDDSISLDFAM